MEHITSRFPSSSISCIWINEKKIRHESEHWDRFTSGKDTVMRKIPHCTSDFSLGLHVWGEGPVKEAQLRLVQWSVTFCFVHGLKPARDWKTNIKLYDNDHIINGLVLRLFRLMRLQTALGFTSYTSGPFPTTSDETKKSFFFIDRDKYLYSKAANLCL